MNNDEISDELTTGDCVISNSSISASTLRSSSSLRSSRRTGRIKKERFLGTFEVTVFVRLLLRGRRRR